MTSGIIQACIATHRQMAELMACQPSLDPDISPTIVAAIVLVVGCLLAAVYGHASSGTSRQER